MSDVCSSDLLQKMDHVVVRLALHGVDDPEVAAVQAQNPGIARLATPGRIEDRPVEPDAAAVDADHPGVAAGQGHVFAEQEFGRQGGHSSQSGRGRFFSRRKAGLKRSEEHTSELQSLMRISYAVFCLKKKKKKETRQKK